MRRTGTETLKGASQRAGRWLSVWAGTVLLLVAALTGACSATPLPEPPTVAPPDLSRVVLEPSMLFDVVEVRIGGSAGAVEPGQLLWAINLDRVDPPASVTAGEDGSFSMKVTGLAGETIRLQARSAPSAGDRVGRSPPLDLVAPNVAQQPERLVLPLGDCLLVDPELALESGGTEVLTLRNDCDADVRIGSITLRTDGPFTLEPPAPLIVPRATTETIVVTAPAGPLVEEVVLIGIDAPEVERRAVTLYEPE